MEGVAKSYWEFWRQPELSAARVYTDTLRGIVAEGKMEDLGDLYGNLVNGDVVDEITIRLVLSLRDLLSTYSED
jgi:hypothetical protein